MCELELTHHFVFHIFFSMKNVLIVIQTIFDLKFAFSSFQNNNLTPVSLGNSSLYVSSSGRNRKRKRLKEKYLLTGESSPQPAQKRRSSVSDLTRLSEGSFLDYTFASTITEGSCTLFSIVICMFWVCRPLKR